MHSDEITHRVIGAAILVHCHVKVCTGYELTTAGLFVERQKEIPLIYKGVRMDCFYRVDMIVERQVIVEFKCVDKIHPVHEAQTITYLKLTGLSVGLILNFLAPVLKDGIKRLVHGYRSQRPGASAVELIR